MDRVVVGFDGSPAAVAALEWAVAEARWRARELEVVAVAEWTPFGGDVASEDEAALGELRRTVVDLAGEVPATFRVARGGTAAELVAACAATDLLVVGTRGRNPFAGFLLGSVSRACLHHAPCAVVLVRPAPETPQAHGRVIVGIDESEHGRRALVVAAEEAALRGAELQVVHAVHWDRIGAELIVPTTPQLLAWGKELVAGQLAATGVEAKVLVLHGSAAELLVRHSARADLLVLGSRGRNPLESLTLGSTSDHCARHAACPVMVVRPAQ